MSLTYSRFRNASLRRKEKNDCSVVAAAIAMDESYDLVHAAFQRNGRRKGKTTYFETTRKVMKEFGFALEEVSETDPLMEIPTLIKFRKHVPATEILLIRTCRHILCARDGELHCWTSGSRRRILEIYRVIQL